ncbi:MAG: plasmid mobilization relaxosome protein MobC [Clostridia bacterium]|nr:plasmid mobilization relaxosome protein MobC [Clostridia bacterium]
MERRSRNIHVGTRLNEAEYKKLKELENSTGLGSTTLLRKLITGAELKAKPTPELRNLQRSIDRIGNNLNQIAHRANAAGVLEKSEWDRTKTLMTALKEEIQKWR